MNFQLDTVAVVRRTARYRKVSNSSERYMVASS
jgi:hypothetical protein